MKVLSKLDGDYILPSVTKPMSLALTRFVIEAYVAQSDRSSYNTLRKILDLPSGSLRGHGIAVNDDGDHFCVRTKVLKVGRHVFFLPVVQHS